MKKTAISILMAILASTNCTAQNANEQSNRNIDGLSYKLTTNKEILVDTIVNNLQASEVDIFAAAKDYMVNAYRDTKYEIVKDDTNKCSIVGKGCLLHFFNCQLGLNQYYLNTEFNLQIDAKEGKMRISLLADKYSGECIDGNNTKKVDDKIASFMPVDEYNSNKKNMYTKAFPEIMQTFHKIKREIAEHVKNKISVISNDSDW